MWSEEEQHIAMSVKHITIRASKNNKQTKIMIFLKNGMTHQRDGNKFMCAGGIHYYSFCLCVYVYGFGLCGRDDVALH